MPDAYPEDGSQVVETSDNEEKQELSMLRRWKHSVGGPEPSERRVDNDDASPRKRRKLSHCYSPPVPKLQTHTHDTTHYACQDSQLLSCSPLLFQEQEREVSWMEASLSQDPLLLEPGNQDEDVESSKQSTINEHFQLSNPQITPGHDPASDDELLLDNDDHSTDTDTVTTTLSRFSISPRKHNPPSYSLANSRTFHWSSPRQYSESETTADLALNRSPDSDGKQRYASSPPRTATSETYPSQSSARAVSYFSLFGSPGSLTSDRSEDTGPLLQPSSPCLPSHRLSPPPLLCSPSARYSSPLTPLGEDITETHGSDRLEAHSLIRQSSTSSPLPHSSRPPSSPPSSLDPSPLPRYSPQTRDSSHEPDVNDLALERAHSPRAPSPPVYPIQHSPSPQSTSHTNDISHPSVSTTLNTVPAAFDYTAIPADLLEESRGRYSFRQRQAKQLNPYVYDKMIYKHQLRGNPDAIVKVVSPNRGGARDRQHRDDCYEETQQEGEDASPPRRRTPPPRNAHIDDVDITFPGQDDLSSTDDEPDRALLKEGRRLMKEERRKEKEAKKLARMAKRFPVRQVGTGRDEERSRSRISISVNSSDELPSFASISHTRLSGSSGLSQMSQQQRSISPIPQQSEDHSAYEDPLNFFDADDDNEVEVYDHIRRASPLLLEHDEEDETMDISSESELEREMTREDRKRLKALNRMMPKFMRDRLLSGRPIHQRERPSTAARRSEDPEEEENIPRPGHARSRISRGSREDRPVVGDSESEEDDERRRQPSVSPDPRLDALPSYRRSPRRHRSRSLSFAAGYERDLRIIDISDLDQSPSSSDSDGGVVDDEDISAYLGDMRGPTSGPNRERNLVDYMLAQTRVVGKRKVKVRHRGARNGRSNRHGNSSGGRGGTSRSNHDHSRHGQGGGGSRSKSNHQHSVSHHSKKRRHSDLRQTKLYEYEVDTASDENDVEIVIEGDPSQQDRLRKEKEKRRQKQMRVNANGLYTFTYDGAQLSGGNGRRARFNIFLEDEGFSNALMPVSYIPPKPKPPDHVNQSIPTTRAPPAPFRPDWDVHAAPDVPDHSVTEPSSRSRYKRRSVVDYFDRPPLVPGVSIGASTYLAKGWLHNLIEVSSGMSPSRPEPYLAHGFDVGPDTTTPQQLGLSIQLVCDRIWHLDTVGVEEEDIPQMKLWQGVMRVHCQLLSWILNSGAPEEDIQSLEEAVVRQIICLMERMNAEFSDVDALTYRALSAGWFSIELAIRLGRRLSHAEIATPSAEGDILSQAIKVMLHHLVRFGVSAALEPIHAHASQQLDNVSVAQRAAEIWICLLHVTDVCSNSTAPGHPLCALAQHVLSSNSLPHVVKNSERSWQTIYGFCILSQFSDIGLSKSTSSLPPSWDFVLFALKQVNLRADEERDHALPPSILEKRDHYIAAIVKRCLNLWNIWHWSLDGPAAASVIAELSHIFRSRKFANLLHEHAEFPEYLRKNDMSLFEASQPFETAFESFLKLVMHAIKPHVGPSTTQGLPPKVKKLLSTFIPSGPILFSRGCYATEEQHSRLFNRLVAISIALYLDPSNVASRMQQARGYVDFLEMDITTKTTCIRGVLYLSLFVVNLGILPIDGLNWFGEMIQLLVTEYDRVNETPVESNIPGYEKGRMVVLGHLMLAICLIIDSVKRVQEAHTAKQGDNGYPHLAFLEGAWVKQVFSSKILAPKAMREIRSFMLSFLAARKAALPPPPRPHLTHSMSKSENEESQDYFEDFGDFDFGDFDALDAALGANSITASEPDHLAEQDVKAAQVIEANIYPMVYLSTSKMFANPDPHIPQQAYLDEADQCIECWIGCASVMVHSGKVKKSSKRWQIYLDLGRGAWENISDTIWRRRITLKVFFSILMADPMTYKTMSEKYLHLFRECLVVANVTMEPEFVSFLFSIDGLRDPMLRNMDLDLRRNPLTGDVEITTSEYVAKRIGFINTIFSNVNIYLLEGSNHHSPDNIEKHEQLVKWLCYLLLDMKTTFMLEKKTPTCHVAYATFCSRVFELLDAYPRLKCHPSLSTLVRWGADIRPSIAP